MAIPLSTSVILSWWAKYHAWKLYIPSCNQFLTTEYISTLLQHENLRQDQLRLKQSTHLWLKITSVFSARKFFTYHRVRPTNLTPGSPRSALVENHQPARNITEPRVDPTNLPPPPRPLLPPKHWVIHPLGTVQSGLINKAIFRHGTGLHGKDEPRRPEKNPSKL